jgi:hypothetical protein
MYSGTLYSQKVKSVTSLFYTNKILLKIEGAQNENSSCQSFLLCFLVVNPHAHRVYKDSFWVLARHKQFEISMMTSNQTS